jgi:Squalene epoxidase
MTVGLSDAVVVRDLLASVRDLNDTQTVNKQLQKLYVKRKGYSSTINILSWALYHVFTASNGTTPLLLLIFLLFLVMGFFSFFFYLLSFHFVCFLFLFYSLFYLF